MPSVNFGNNTDPCNKHTPIFDRGASQAKVSSNSCPLKSCLKKTPNTFAPAHSSFSPKLIYPKDTQKNILMKKASSPPKQMIEQQLAVSADLRKDHDTPKVVKEITEKNKQIKIQDAYHNIKFPPESFINSLQGSIPENKVPETSGRSANPKLPGTNNDSPYCPVLDEYPSILNFYFHSARAKTKWTRKVPIPSKPTYGIPETYRPAYSLELNSNLSSRSTSQD